MDIPTKKLNNGINIPTLGLGTWKAKEGNEVEKAVLWALQSGYRLIDTAKIYGNEEGVGEAIAQSGIPRKQIFVTTKLWNVDQGYKEALLAIDESLARLGMDYVDLYLIHWPFTNRTSGENKRAETWKAMEEIYKAGKAKAIGVSNYTIEHLEEIQTYAAVTPAVNQVEFHPFLYQKELMGYCQNNNIALEAYCPLSQGHRLQNEQILQIAQGHKKTSAQVMLRWSIQHGNIVIPKSIHKERIEKNLQIFDFELSGKEMGILDGLNVNYRIVNF